MIFQLHLYLLALTLVTFPLASFSLRHSVTLHSNTNVTRYTSLEDTSLYSPTHSLTHSHTPTQEKKVEISYIDIVITVKTNIKFVRNCVNSLLRHAPDSSVYPYLQQRIIFVDDGSPQDTQQYEQNMCQLYKDMFFCTNTTNKEKGYTWAVMKGIRLLGRRGYVESVAVVLLNSDTIVTNGWLVTLYHSLNKDPSTMIAGPLSNAATWQSVPHPFLAENTIPLGLGIDKIAREVKRFASKENIQEVPIYIINGFCFMFKRELLHHIGGFDTTNFGPGYGEEVDFCLRSHKQGYTAVIDPYTFIFHTKTASFQSKEKKDLNLKSHKILDKKYGKLLEKYKDEKYVSRKKLTPVTKNVEHLYKVYDMLYSRYHRPSILFVVDEVIHMGDFLHLLNIVYYIKSQDISVWVEVLTWNTEVYPPLADFLQIHFPDFSAAVRNVVFVSQDVSSPSTPSSELAGKSDFTLSAVEHSHIDAQVIIAMSIDVIPVVYQKCKQSRHKTTAAYIVDDFPVLSGYATGKEHEQYVSFLQKFVALNRSVIVLSRSQWVIDTATQENSDIEIHKNVKSIDKSVFYIPESVLRKKTSKSNRNGDTFHILVRFRGSKAIDQSIFLSLILLSQQKASFKFRILDPPSQQYISELRETLQIGSLISKHAVDVTYDNFDFVSFDYTEPLSVMADIYRESDFFVDASELTGWALQRTVVEVQACGCIMVLPTGSMAQSIADDNCLVFEMTRANKLQKLLTNYLVGRAESQRIADKLNDEMIEISYEEDALSLLTAVSTMKSKKELLSTQGGYQIDRTFLFYALVGCCGVLVLLTVFKTFIAPGFRSLKLYKMLSDEDNE